MDNLEIAKRIGEGDETATNSFVREHYASVLRFMRHLTRNIEDAEDLTQQAFIRARANAKSYKGNSSLKTWLHRIAFHEYTHWKRKRRNTETLSAELALHDPRFAACIEAAVLLEALHRLSSAHRDVFLLHEVQELSIEDVAFVLKKPVGTIKSRLFHAKKQLRKDLERQKEEKRYGERTFEAN